MQISDENTAPTNPLPADYYRVQLQIADDLLLAKAKAGEIWAIQNLLKLIADAVVAGVPLPKNIATFISTALNAINNGVAADEAFGIKRGRGEKDTRKANQRQFAIAYYIETKEGTLEDKCELAAIEFDISEHTAKAAWKKNHKMVKHMLALDKKVFGVA